MRDGQKYKGKKVNILNNKFIQGALFLLLPLSLQANYQEGFYINTRPQGATIFLEGEIIGKSPFWFPHDMNGNYKLKAKKQGYETWVRSIDFRKGPIDSIHISLKEKKQVKAVLRSFIIPGWGQRYSQQDTKSKIFLLSEIVALAGLSLSQLNYRNKLDDFNQAKSDYDQMSLSYLEERAAWNHWQNNHAQLEDAYQTRNILLITSLAIYALNIFDSLFFYPEIRKEIEFIKFQPPLLSSNRIHIIQLSFKL
ncbi:PEGA domain-containing protein [candidate division KSB1 bacterium]|nr:PEGA domain-containing protein [candidate division KSB1 bacterium]